MRIRPPSELRESLGCKKTGGGYLMKLWGCTSGGNARCNCYLLPAVEALKGSQCTTGFHLQISLRPQQKQKGPRVFTRVLAPSATLVIFGATEHHTGSCSSQHSPQHAHPPAEEAIAAGSQITCQRPCRVKEIKREDKASSVIILLLTPSHPPT